MAILENEIWITLNPNNVKYYEGLKYTIPKRKDSNGQLRFAKGTKILVKVKDISIKSGERVTKICDECGSHVKNQRMIEITTQRQKTDGRDFCFDCGKTNGGNTKRNKVPYEKSLEFNANKNNLRYLLNEFSDKNTKSPSEIFYGSNDKYWWNCPKFGTEHQYNEQVVKRTVLGQGCPYCDGKKVNQTNCLLTTHPNIEKLLYNINDGYKYTAGSNKKIDWKCPDCEYVIKNKMIISIVKRGLSCPQCSDGVSYPEKFIFNLFNQIKVDLETQKVFSWSNKKRYDFYIPSIHAILEVHGKQHYFGDFSYLGGKTIKEEQENDKQKREIAIKNKIKKYIIIDARKSEIEWMKKSVLNSELNKLFDFSKVEWFRCHEHACNSYVKIVCDLFNKNKTVSEIHRELSFAKSTVRRYLKQGEKIGLCSYNPLKNKNVKLATNQVIEIKKMIAKGHKNKNIAEIFNISSHTISDIKNGRTWLDVNIHSVI